VDLITIEGSDMGSKKYKAEYELKSRNLQLRGRIWFYRESVPPELRERMGCSEITRTLGTESVTEAERAAEIVDQEVRAIIKGARADRLLDVEALVSKLSSTYLKRLIAGDRHLRRTGAFGDPDDFDIVRSVLTDEAEEIGEDLERRKFDSVRDDARAWLAAEGITLEGENSTETARTSS
jgi:hypothetical protein